MAKKTNVTISELAAGDGRYAPEAYELVYQALCKTSELLKAGKLETANLPSYGGDRHPGGEKDRMHVSGQELLEGFRIAAQELYGALAIFLLRRWGLYPRKDVGEVVFLMVEAGMMGKQEADTRADFANGYDFAEVFAPPEED